MSASGAGRAGAESFNWAGADQRRKWNAPGDLRSDRSASIGPALISAGNAAAETQTSRRFVSFNWAGADQRRKSRQLAPQLIRQLASIGPALISAGNNTKSLTSSPSATLQLGRR